MRDRDFIDRLLDIQEKLAISVVYDEEKEKEFEFVSDMIQYLIKIQKKEEMKTAKAMKEKTKSVLYNKNKDQIEDILGFIEEIAELGEDFIYCDDINWYIKEWLTEHGYRVYKGTNDVKISWGE